MDLNARVDVNCGWKDGRTENRTPISHLAKAGETINVSETTTELPLFNDLLEEFCNSLSVS